MAFDLNNKAFIERILNTPVKSFTVSEGCKLGDNVAGSLKCILATTESDQNISAVYKFFPAKDSPVYAFIHEGHIFRTECTAYTVLAQDLEEFVNGRIDQSRDSNGQNSYRLPIPKIFSHFNDDENDYLCLEDVRSQGFIMPSVFNGLSYPEASLSLREIARFHAYSYALIRFRGESHFEPSGKFARLIFSTWRNADKLKEWHAMISGSVQNAIDIFEETNPGLAKVMKEKIPAENAGAVVDTCFLLTDLKLFPCIVHGDFWSNNILIKYDTSSSTERKPVAVKFVDFQLTRRGNLFEDLVYFIFTSTDTEFRKKYLTRVLLDYYESFQQALDAINFPMPIGFTLGFLTDTFYSLAKGSLVNMCFAIPLQMGKPKEAPEQTEQPTISIAKKVKKEALDKGNNSDFNKTRVSSEDQAALFLQMFILSLRHMIKNSPKALKRLEEITEEVLVSGRF